MLEIAGKGLPNIQFTQRQIYYVRLYLKRQYSGSNIILIILNIHLPYIYACTVIPILSQETFILVEGVGIICDEFLQYRSNSVISSPLHCVEINTPNNAVVREMRNVGLLYFIIMSQHLGKHLYIYIICIILTVLIVTSGF